MAMKKHPLSFIIFAMGIVIITLSVGYLSQNTDALLRENNQDPEPSQTQVTSADSIDPDLEHSRREEIQSAVEILIEKGKSAALQKQWENAIRFFKNAEEMAPKNREVALSLGRLQAQVGQDSNANKHFLKALELSKTNSEKLELHNFYGVFLKQRNRPEEAIAQFEALIQLQPSDGYAYFHLGDLARSRGQFETALSHYREAITRIPGHGPSRMGRSFCLIRLNRYAEARARLEEDIKVFPNESTFYHALARVLAAAPLAPIRDGARSLQIVKDLIGELGFYPQLTETLAMALAEVGEYQQAEKFQAQAIAYVGLDLPQERVEQMETLREIYASKKPCRQPWFDDDPIFYRSSYEPEKITEYNQSDVTWKAEKLDMPTRLSQIANQADSSQMIYLNRARAVKLQEQLDNNRDISTFLALQPKYAVELLRAGLSLEARQALEKVEAVRKSNQIEWDPESRYLHLQNLALIHFRMGEQENCQVNHTPESCILPIQGKGVHRIQRGSKAAIAVYKEILALYPNDLNTKWFLNIAYMTLGDYPSGVPKEHLIDPAVFSSKESFPRFLDIAPQVGLDLNTLAGSVIADDFDNDGLLDLVISQWGLSDQLFFFRNTGDGHFENLTEKAGLIGITSGLNIMQTDYNNDGFLDIFMLRGAWMGEAGEHPNSLLRNNGNLTFTDVTEESGLLSFKPTQTATWFDFNNDGFLDVFIGNESGRKVYPSELFMNLGNGTFQEVANLVGIADLGHTKAVASGDYDNDGRTDLFLSRYGQSNKLFRNMGPKVNGDPALWMFEDVTETAGVGEPLKSFPAWFFDFDNDGNLDLFISDYSNTGLRGVVADFLNQPIETEHPRLYRNLGNGRFENVTRSMGLDHPFVTMGSNFGDINNDGFLDFYLGTGTPLMNMVVPNRMFINKDGTFFNDVTFSGGFGHLQKGHGIAFADLDNDGHQDIYAVMGGAFEGDNYPNALFHNPGNSNQWIKISLRGTHSNRFGVGSKITVHLKTATKQDRQIHKTVNSGGSFGSSPLRQEIGLGTGTKIEKLDVFWPKTGKTQTFTDLRPNRSYLLEEDNPQAKTLSTAKVTFQLDSDHQHEH